jgi:hypothetical protein
VNESLRGEAMQTDAMKGLINQFRRFVHPTGKQTALTGTNEGACTISVRQHHSPDIPVAGQAQADVTATPGSGSAEYILLRRSRP